MRYQVFVPLMALVTASCGPEADPIDQVEAATVASTPVRLLYAIGHSRCRGQCLPPYGVARGFVEVKNLAYQKNVFMHYGLRHPAGAWRDVPATYVGPTRPGYEVWRFETPEHAYSPRLSADFDFALRYEVAGSTFWDNNHRANYRVSTGARTLGPKLALGASPVALSEAQTFEVDGKMRFTGQVVVRDLAYHKQVRVVFTTDDWASVHETYASYARPVSAGLGPAQNTEVWAFDTVLPNVADLEFAVQYRVEGRSHWDNNFRRNYRMSVPGKLIER